MAGRADVVRIEAGASRGTGFLIDGRRVVTALHVIGRVVDGALVVHGAMKIAAAVADGSGFRVPVCMCGAGDVVAFDAALDWACVEVDRDAFAGVVPLAVRALADADQGAAWHSYGFPDGAAVDGKATAGNIVSIAAMLRIGSAQVRVVQVFSQEAGTGGVVRGLSGAPVIVGGYAVALLCTGQEDEAARSVEGTMYAVPLAALRDRIPGDAASVKETELCLVEVVRGAVRLTGCLITDDPAALDEEIRVWRAKMVGDPLLAPSIKQRIRGATLRALFDEPVVRPRLLDLVSVGSFALYAYYATAPDADRADRLLRLPLAHRLRKKRERIARIHTRVDIAAALDAAIAQVEAEEGRTLARPAVAASPLIDLADGLFAIVARRLAEPASEDAATDFAFIQAKTRLAFDVVTYEARTRDENPL